MSNRVFLNKEETGWFCDNIDHLFRHKGGGLYLLYDTDFVKGSDGVWRTHLKYRRADGPNMEAPESFSRTVDDFRGAFVREDARIAEFVTRLKQLSADLRDTYDGDWAASALTDIIDDIVIRRAQPNQPKEEP